MPKRSAKRDSEAGIARVSQVGLDCMELEFVRRVSMGEEKAARVKAVASELGISLSVHAPYYINLNSRDPAILRGSKRRLIDAAGIGALCGAESVAFHPGFYMGESPGKTFGRIKKNFMDVRRRLEAGGIDIQLRPETSGRPSQFGRLDELLALSGELNGVPPCVDFAHMHAYEGAINSYDEFAAALDKIRSRLGRAALSDMHIHVSGIRFGPRGEREHLNLADSDFNYLALLRALRDFSVGGRVVCESPDREADALLMKAEYRRMRSLKRGGKAGNGIRRDRR